MDEFRLQVALNRANSQKFSGSISEAPISLGKRPRDLQHLDTSMISYTQYFKANPSLLKDFYSLLREQAADPFSLQEPKNKHANHLDLVDRMR
jgi:hypothetical protein